MASRKERKALEKFQKRLATENPTMKFDFGAEILQFGGPIITTDIGITDSHEKALTQAGLPVPDRVRCRLLVDTGADQCVIKHEIAEKAGLKLISDNAPIHGVGVDTSGRSYVGRVWFACKSKQDEGTTHQIWIDSEIGSGSLPFDQIDGLIGRDVLRHFDMRYNGVDGQLTMKFIKKRH